MKQNELGRGVIVPMVTPVTANGQIDMQGVAKLINHIIAGGAAPFILGTTGESASIAEVQRPAFVQKMVEVVNQRTYTYAGISSTSYQTSLQTAKRYFDLGVDAVVAHPPAYYPLNADQLLKYYQQLADNIPGPLILYNITSVTHVSIPLTVADKLSKHERIIGLKDSERDIERLNASLKLWSDREDFNHLVGWGTQMANGLRHGSTGLVPSTGNLLPAAYVEMIKAAEMGNSDELDRLQSLLNEISEIYQKNRSLGGSLAALKVMLQQLDICEAHMLLPLLRLDPEEEKIITGAMKKYDDFVRI